ncbi:MAG: hypothetical protein ABIO45_01225 [Burkholderiaceae bacterium]
MNVKPIAIAALSVLAFAANVVWAEGATYVYPQKIVATQSRADVRNEARSAAPSALQNLGDIVVDARPVARSTVQRADVREQARREVRTHEISARLLP